MVEFVSTRRLDTLDAALRLAADLTTTWPIDDSDIRAARDLATSEPGLAARDLIHLAVCRRHGAGELLSFDRALVAAFASGS